MSNPPSGPSPSFSPADPSKIEFHCQGCQRLLQVPVAAIGRSVKCPQCQSIQLVTNPAAGQNAPNVVSPSVVSNSPQLTPIGQLPSGSPFPSGNAPSAVPPVNPPFATSQPPLPNSQPIPSAPVPNHPVPNHPVPSQPVASPAFGQRPAGFGSPVGPTMANASATPPITSLRGMLHTSKEENVGRETPTKLLFDRITAEIGKLYVGQDELVLGSLVALFSNGHVLIESVPGLGKTLFVRALGRVLGCRFNRIQFTADLMPSDITGAPIFDMKTQDFRFRPGPVFTQLLLADEINRSPAKTHAALLEIMQEYRVTIDGISHQLDRPFLVLATQNPIESEGTYNLPEAQLDRFMFKLIVDYPHETEEADILKLHSRQLDINKRLEEELQTVTSPEEINRICAENGQVLVDDKLIDYINKIVRLTRKWPQFHMGASPRAGLALVQGARTLAAFCGRDYAVPDDVVQIVLPALRHRVMLTAEAEVEGHKVDDLLTQLIRSVEVPRL